YMVGEDILTAPVVQQGQTKRAVYLPKGEWIDFWNGVEYSGGNTILVDAPIDKLPLFIKKDTILPWGKEVDHISDEPDKDMTFRVFGNGGKYRHYQDNGVDFEYRSEEHTSELQSRFDLVCRLLLEKKKRTDENISMR